MGCWILGVWAAPVSYTLTMAVSGSRSGGRMRHRTSRRHSARSTAGIGSTTSSAMMPAGEHVGDGVELQEYSLKCRSTSTAKALADSRQVIMSYLYTYICHTLVVELRETRYGSIIRLTTTHQWKKMEQRQFKGNPSMEGNMHCLLIRGAC